MVIGEKIVPFITEFVDELVSEKKIPRLLKDVSLLF